MAQFACEICGAEFEQKSRYERHMQTSHPKQAVSAADIEKTLKGVDFPKSRDELVDRMGDEAQPVRDILERLPDREYRDAAEVARAFGELRTHEKAPQNQPSKTGGERAMQASSSSPSAARFASLFAGMQFPASRDELKQHARAKASEEEMQILEKFGGHTYHNMAYVTKELNRVS
ncbi:DUF2795 domain-containing protein [Halomonas sp. TRM85114]|uniref:DUF2795 domain-containing protein n=1 Tax=Halomonas jincaotanensis TaxID=2810616 RepID=UPI001BD1EA6A|nr:DUF2795 domain-containing protein [Halomonas jincaotanensis]MBS9402249.1 DUF2795 domain-containing protein [Halomonas jincaotanensis]